MRNFHRLRDMLRPELEGLDAVVTHNPWGEYGHEEHIQVFRVISAQAEEMGFRVWVSC